MQGLTSESDPKWHQNQLKFLIESAVSSCHGNYNLDPNVEKREMFTEFHNKLLVELLEKSKDYRKYRVKKKRNLQMPSPKPDSPLCNKKPRPSPARHRKKYKLGSASKVGLTCPGRSNLAAYLRKTSLRRRCNFCSKRNNKTYTCRSCGGFFCMEPPENLIDPFCELQKNFRKDGPFCWHRYHGFTTWAELCG